MFLGFFPSKFAWSHEWDCSVSLNHSLIIMKCDDFHSSMSPYRKKTPTEMTQPLTRQSVFAIWNVWIQIRKCVFFLLYFHLFSFKYLFLFHNFEYQHQTYNFFFFCKYYFWIYACMYLSVLNLFRSTFHANEICDWLSLFLISSLFMSFNDNIVCNFIFLWLLLVRVRRCTLHIAHTQCQMIKSIFLIGNYERIAHENDTMITNQNISWAAKDINLLSNMKKKYQQMNL